MKNTIFVDEKLKQNSDRKTRKEMLFVFRFALIERGHGQCVPECVKQCNLLIFQTCSINRFFQLSNLKNKN